MARAVKGRTDSVVVVGAAGAPLGVEGPQRLLTSLTGVLGLLRKARVKIVHGRAKFRDGKTVDGQVAAGARHVTFGDPDFFNGPTHARRLDAREQVCQERHAGRGALHAPWPDERLAMDVDALGISLVGGRSHDR